MKFLIVLAFAAMACAAPQYVEEPTVAAQKALHQSVNPYTFYDELGTPFAAAAPAPLITRAVAAAPLISTVAAAAPAPLITRVAAAYPSYSYYY